MDKEEERTVYVAAEGKYIPMEEFKERLGAPGKVEEKLILPPGYTKEHLTSLYQLEKPSGREKD